MSDLKKMIALARAAIADHRAHIGKHGIRWYDQERIDRVLDREPRLAAFIVDTFDQSVPCGFEAPRVSRELVSKELHVFWTVDDHEMAFTSDQAIALGAFLMAAGFDAQTPS